MTIPEPPNPPSASKADAPRPDEADPKQKRVFGSMRGELAIPDAFFDPLPPEELALWEQDGDAADRP